MTLTELKAKVLEELGVLATGESPFAADATVVSDKYSALYDMLLTEGLVTWTATDDIPEFAEGPVVAMLSHLCAKPFGVPQAKRIELERDGALNLNPPSTAERQLRRQLTKGYVYAPAQTEYF